MEKTSRIYIAGHRGLVGSNLHKILSAQGYENLITEDHSDVDLTRETSVADFFDRTTPEYVFLAAAKVGGILANSKYPVDFLEQNLRIQTNCIHHAHRTGTKKLLFFASNCVYPTKAPQPMSEDLLLTGPLEPSNQWYAVAKIAGIKMCQAYQQQFGFNAISVMPASLYGPGDNFDAQNAHVLPALIRKFVEAKKTGAAEVEVWGSGRPKREFLFVEDLVDAAIFLMQNYDSPEIINIGAGTDLAIADLAQQIKEITGFTGQLRFDSSKPDGTMQKLLNPGKINALGWRAKTPLRQGLEKTIAWYSAQQASS